MYTCTRTKGSKDGARVMWLGEEITQKNCPEDERGLLGGVGKGFQVKTALPVHSRKPRILESFSKP